MFLNFKNLVIKISTVAILFSACSFDSKLNMYGVGGDKKVEAEEFHNVRPFIKEEILDNTPIEPNVIFGKNDILKGNLVGEFMGLADGSLLSIDGGKNPNGLSGSAHPATYFLGDNPKDAMIKLIPGYPLDNNGNEIITEKPLVSIEEIIRHSYIDNLESDLTAKVLKIFKFNSYDETGAGKSYYGLLMERLQDTFYDDVYSNIDTLAKKLQFLHNKGIKHGDLKPANILGNKFIDWAVTNVAEKKDNSVEYKYCNPFFFSETGTDTGGFARSIIVKICQKNDFILHLLEKQLTAICANKQGVPVASLIGLMGMQLTKGSNNTEFVQSVNDVTKGISNSLTKSNGILSKETKENLSKYQEFLMGVIIQLYQKAFNAKSEIAAFDMLSKDIIGDYKLLGLQSGASENKNSADTLAKYLKFLNLAATGELGIDEFILRCSDIKK